MLEIDCMQATDGERFLRLLAESLMAVFATPEEVGLIEYWIRSHPLSLEESPKGLVYGPKYGYRIALPLLGIWLKHRIG